GWGLPWTAHGVMNGTWTLRAGAKFGSVSWYVPGSLFGGVQLTTAADPSLARRARICRATSRPTATPCMARPGGMPARSSARAASKTASREGDRRARGCVGAGAAAAARDGAGGGRLLRGAVRGMHLGEVGLVGPVDGVDGVEHGDVNERQVARQGDARRLAGQRLEQHLVPVQRHVGGQQAPILQRLDAEHPLL